MGVIWALGSETGIWCDFHMSRNSLHLSIFPLLTNVGSPLGLGAGQQQTTAVLHSSALGRGWACGPPRQTHPGIPADSR